MKTVEVKARNPLEKLLDARQDGAGITQTGEKQQAGDDPSLPGE